jgi:hypothetical protein
MTADLENQDQSPDEDINTTAPQPEPEAWKMPEPVFRKTSGRLPKGFDKPFEFDPEPQALSNETEEPSVPPVTVLTPEPRPKSPALKLLVVILALTAMVAFLVVFVSIIYFFFWR